MMEGAAGEGAQLALQFPYIVPASTSERPVYHGFITVQDQDFQVKLSTGASGNIHFECCDLLRSVICGSESIVMKRVSQCSSIYEVLVELEEVLDRVLGYGNFKRVSSSIHYETLVKDIEQVGWDKLVSVDEMLTSLSFAVRDKKQRVHSLSLTVPSDYPESSPIVNSSLPGMNMSMKSKNASITEAVDAYVSALGSFQDFWDVMDDLDSHTWVLEPEHPTRDVTSRRISAGRHCSIILQINPRKPFTMPVMKFLGSDRAAGALRDLHNERLHLWNETDMPRLNVERVLQLELPKRPAAEEGSDENSALECAICYSYRLQEGSVPDKTCDNPQCGRSFHMPCLYEWLRGVATNRHSYDTLFGECPYCTCAITARKPKVT